jgi:hypothetical protein
MREPLASENPLAVLAEKSSTSVFGDKRLERRGISLLGDMLEQGSVVINQIAKGQAQRMGYYRLLNNDKADKASIVSGMQELCARNVRDNHVLLINDTSEINLQAQAAHLDPDDPDLGVVGNNRDIGFFVHPSLVLDAEQGDALGLAGVQVWTRKAFREDKQARRYKTQPIEDKESYKWLRALEASESCLAEAKMVTLIADRESDSYELLCRCPDDRQQVLIRACRDRAVEGEAGSLFEAMSHLPFKGSYRIEVTGDKRKQQPTREALLEVRAGVLTLNRPKRLAKDERYPRQLRIYALEVREHSSTAPKGQAKILWRLLTSHCVESFEQARQVVQWYAWRWQIEQLFRLLKKQALDVEASRMTTGHALQLLTVLALVVALRVMQLSHARDGSERPVTLCFTDQEITCLAQLAPSLEGNTKKQQNPFPSYCLAWAAWVIARLGGWKGYQSQAKPGVITMFRGLKRFDDLFQGWLLASETT